MGRQPKFAVEAKSYPAALQNLHCLHSLLWRGLLGHFSSDFPAIPFDVTFLVFDQEKDLPGEVLAFLSFSHLVYCLQLYGWVLNSWKAISSLPFQVFSITLYPGEPYPES